MRRTRGWTGLRTSVVALGLVAAATPGARADSMNSATSTSTLLAYDTQGSSIDNTKGVTGTPSITFTPVIGATFMSPSNLSLGEFHAAALPAGQAVTYNNTPFDLKFNVDGVNGNPSFKPNQSPVDITGKLNGTLSGSGQSSVMATFDAPPVLTPPAADPTSYLFATGLYNNTLKITNNPIAVVPSAANGGVSTAQAMLTTEVAPTAPVPEPSTVVLFAATIAGLGFRHRLRRGRDDA